MIIECSSHGGVEYRSHFRLDTECPWIHFQRYARTNL